MTLHPRREAKKAQERTSRKTTDARLRELEEDVLQLIDITLQQKEEIQVLTDRFWKVTRLLRKYQLDLLRKSESLDAVASEEDA